jgi:hypothetical protein
MMTDGNCAASRHAARPLRVDTITTQLSLRLPRGMPLP